MDVKRIHTPLSLQPSPDGPVFMSKTLLEVKEIKTIFWLSQGMVHTVNGVSFSVHKGKVLGPLRCPLAQEVCSVGEPQARPVGSEHMIACHFA